MGCSYSGLNALYDAVNGGGDVWINENRFKIIRQLGEGGLAYVYLVKEVVTDASAGLSNKLKDPSFLSGNVLILFFCNGLLRFVVIMWVIDSMNYGIVWFSFNWFLISGYENWGLNDVLWSNWVVGFLLWRVDSFEHGFLWSICNWYVILVGNEVYFWWWDLSYEEIDNLN